jgi:outer membrane protein OmpA-like peptidoglycan-associated protein
LKVAAQHPEARISIEAHTDSVGTTAYNVDLAERRAVSVVRYLLINETPEELLLSRSFGENRPRAKNTNADGSDNEAGRALNRRVTLVLIK